MYSSSLAWNSTRSTDASEDSHPKDPLGGWWSIGGCACCAYGAASRLRAYALRPKAYVRPTGANALRLSPSRGCKANLGVFSIYLHDLLSGVLYLHGSLWHPLEPVDFHQKFHHFQVSKRRVSKALSVRAVEKELTDIINDNHSL